MVHQELINYFQEGKRRGFTIDRLKQELIKNGFNEKDVNIAAGFVDGVQQTPQTSQIQPVKPVQPVQQRRNFQSSPKIKPVHPRPYRQDVTILPASEEKEESHKGMIILLVTI